MVKDKSPDPAIATATHPTNGFISNGEDYSKTSRTQDLCNGITVDVGSDDIQQNGAVLGNKETKAQKKKNRKSLLNKFFRRNSTSNCLDDDSAVNSVLQNGVCNNGDVINGYDGANGDGGLDDNVDNGRIETRNDTRTVVNRNGNIETVPVIIKHVANRNEHLPNSVPERVPERRLSNGKLSASESKSLNSFQVEKTESGETVAVLRGTKNTPLWRKEHGKTPAEEPNIKRAMKSRASAGDVLNKEHKRRSGFWSILRSTRSKTNADDTTSREGNGTPRSDISMKRRSTDCTELQAGVADNGSTRYGVKADQRPLPDSPAQSKAGGISANEDGNKTPRPPRPLPPLLEDLEKNAWAKKHAPRRVSLDDNASGMDKSMEKIRPPMLMRRGSEDNTLNDHGSTSGANPPLLKKVHSGNNIIADNENGGITCRKEANTGDVNTHMTNSPNSIHDNYHSDETSLPVLQSRTIEHCDSPDSSPAALSNITELSPTFASDHRCQDADSGSPKSVQDLDHVKMNQNEKDSEYTTSSNKMDRSNDDKTSKRSKEKHRTPKGYNSLSRLKNDVVKKFKFKLGNDKASDCKDDSNADVIILKDDKNNLATAGDNMMSKDSGSETRGQNAGADNVSTGADDNPTTYPITQAQPSQAYSILGDKNNNSSHATVQPTSRNSSTLSNESEPIHHKHIENVRCVTPVTQFKASCKNDETNVSGGLQDSSTIIQSDTVLQSHGHHDSSRNQEMQIGKSERTNGSHVSCIEIHNHGNSSSNDITHAHMEYVGKGEAGEDKCRNNDAADGTGARNKTIDAHNNENVISVNRNSEIAIVAGKNNKSGRKKSKAPIAPGQGNIKAKTTGNSNSKDNCDNRNLLHANTSDTYNSVIKVTNKAEHSNVNNSKQYSLNTDPHDTQRVSPALKVTNAVSSVSDQSSESEFTEVSSVDTSIYVGTTGVDSQRARVVSSNGNNPKSSLVVLPVLHGGDANPSSVLLHPQTTSSEHPKVSDSDSSARKIDNEKVRKVLPNSVSAPQLLVTQPDHYESLEIDDGSWSSTDTGTQHTTSSGNKDLSSSARSESKSSSSATRHENNQRRSEQDVLRNQSRSNVSIGPESERIDQLHTPIMKNSVSMSNLYGQPGMDSSSLKRNVRRMSSSSWDLERSKRGQSKGKLSKFSAAFKNMFKSRPAPDIKQQLQYEIHAQEDRMRSQGMEVPPNDDPRIPRPNMIAALPATQNEDTRSRFSMADSGIYQGYGSETLERYNGFANARNSTPWRSLNDVTALHAKTSHEQSLSRSRASLAPCMAYQENSANTSPKRPPRRRRKRSKEPVLIPSRTALKKSSSGNTGDSSSLSDIDKSGTKPTEKQPVRSKGKRSNKEIQDSDKFNSVSSAKTYASLDSFSSFAELEREAYEREGRQRARTNHKAERSKNRSAQDLRERRPHSVGRSALLEKEFKIVETPGESIPPTERRRKRYENRHQQMERRRLTSTDEPGSRPQRRSSRNLSNGNILDPGIMPRLDEHVIADYSKALGRPLDERLIAETLWQKIYAQLLHDLDTENMEDEYRHPGHRKAEDQDERRSKTDEGYSSVRSSRSSRDEVELQQRLSADQSLENQAPQSYIGRNRYEPRQYDWRLSGTLRKERITPNLKANPPQEQLEQHGWLDQKGYPTGGAEPEPERSRLSSDRKSLGLENLKLNGSGYMWRPTDNITVVSV